MPQSSEGVAQAEMLIWQAQGLTLPLPPSHYLDFTAVDRLAKPLDEVSVAAPPEVGAGRVVLVLFISATGQVDGAMLESTDLPAPFVDSALDAFRKVRFAPARRMGKPVPMRYRIEASFGYSVLGNEATHDSATHAAEK